MIFIFETDAESQKYCEEIVAEIVNVFGVNKEEAIKRVNQKWVSCKIVGEDDPVYHEDPEYWAKEIGYGHDSEWWVDEASAKLRELPE